MTKQPDTGVTRRELLVRAGAFGVVAAAGGLAVTTPGLITAAGALPKPGAPRIAGVTLPSLPFFANLATVMTPAQASLDALATEYGHRTANPTIEDFISVWMPSRLVEDAVSPFGARRDLGEMLWMLYVSGYYGGVWLRLEMIHFGTPRGGAAPTEAAVTPVVSQLAASIGLIQGSDDAAALAGAGASLRGAPLVSVADNYGYNVGYVDQILKGGKPTNAVAPSDLIQFTDAGLFDATYGIDELRGLELWRFLSRSGNGWWRSSHIDDVIVGAGGADDLRSIQAAGAQRGRLTWSVPQLSIKNWDQPSYDLLLLLSVIYIEVIQVAGMMALAAAGRDRADWARQALWTGAGLSALGAGDLLGFRNKSLDLIPLADAYPKFVWS
jgi:hypothetical protein